MRMCVVVCGIEVLAVAGARVALSLTEEEQAEEDDLRKMMTAIAAQQSSADKDAAGLFSV